MTETDPPGDSEEWPTLDESFVQGARIRENAPTQPLSSPSRASMREVKREARQRRRSAKRSRQGSDRRPAARRPREWKRPAMMGALVIVALGSVVWYGQTFSPAELTSGGVIADLKARSDENSGSDDQAGDPWSSSAAASWPTSIEAPRAQAVQGFSRSDVADALTVSEKYLNAAILNDQVLYRGATKPVLESLANSASVREYLGDPRKDITWTNAATRFRPHLFGPADEAVHLRGFIKPSAPDGELTVDFSFAVAYAVEGLREAEPQPVVVVVRREGTLTFGDASTGSVGLPYPSYLAAVSDRSDCDAKWPYPAFTQVLLEPPTRDLTPGPAPTQSADLTDPEDSLRDITECFTNTGRL